MALFWTQHLESIGRVFAKLLCSYACLVISNLAATCPVSGACVLHPNPLIQQHVNLAHRRCIATHSVPQVLHFLDLRDKHRVTIPPWPKTSVEGWTCIPPRWAWNLLSQHGCPCDIALVSNPRCGLPTSHWALPAANQQPLTYRMLESESPMAQLWHMCQTPNSQRQMGSCFTVLLPHWRNSMLLRNFCKTFARNPLQINRRIHTLNHGWGLSSTWLHYIDYTIVLGSIFCLPKTIQKVLASPRKIRD